MSETLMRLRKIFLNRKIAKGPFHALCRVQPSKNSRPKMEPLPLFCRIRCHLGAKAKMHSAEDPLLRRHVSYFKVRGGSRRLVLH